MACHRAAVTAPGPGGTALRAVSLPCGDEAAGGGRARVQIAGGDRDPLVLQVLPLLPPPAHLTSRVQRLNGTRERTPAANRTPISLNMVCYFCCLLMLSACDGRLALVVVGISPASLLDCKTRVWVLVGFAGGVFNTPRETRRVVLT